MRSWIDKHFIAAKQSAFIRNIISWIKNKGVDHLYVWISVIYAWEFISFSSDFSLTWQIVIWQIIIYQWFSKCGKLPPVRLSFNFLHNNKNFTVNSAIVLFVYHWVFIFSTIGLIYQDLKMPFIYCDESLMSSGGICENPVCPTLTGCV